jgi:hypothetical protein
MPKKIAVKRLRSSDLSLFKSYLTRGLTRGKQKGFNLDKAILEGEFFPSLWEALLTKPKKAVHVDLLLNGPGMRGAESLSRKVKIDAKNFRLNGEVVANPESDPGRYDSLRLNDFAILEFGGHQVPTSVRVLLIAEGESQDRKLHEVLAARFPTGSMHVLSGEQLSSLIQAADPDPAHPVRSWAEDPPLEEVAAGSVDAIERLNKGPAHRGLSLEELQDAKAAAELTGQRGEALVDAFLAGGLLVGLSSYEWTSNENAIAPYDFGITVAATRRNVDVKSTSGPFENPMHLSLNEVRVACAGQEPYDLFRVFKVDASSGRLRIARDVGPALLPVLKGLSNLPAGVTVDSLSIKPSFFQFDEGEYSLDAPNDASEEDSGD